MSQPFKAREEVIIALFLPVRFFTFIFINEYIHTYTLHILSERLMKSKICWYLTFLECIGRKKY